MKRLLLMVAMLAMGLGHAWASTETLQGFCTVGGVRVQTQGIQSSNPVQGSFPRCLVTVYVTGSTIPATIYANGNQGQLANPFTANLDGSWRFWADNSVGYDILLQGGVPPFPVPFILTNMKAGGVTGSAIPIPLNAILDPTNSSAIDLGNFSWQISGSGSTPGSVTINNNGGTTYIGGAAAGPATVIHPGGALDSPALTVAGSAVCTLASPCPIGNVPLDHLVGGTIPYAVHLNDAGFGLTGFPLAPVSGNGANSNAWIGFHAGIGQSTTGITGQTAGSGAILELDAGDGGAAPAGSTNGNGANLTVDAGNPGSGPGNPGTYGKVILQAVGGDTYIGGGAAPATVIHHGGALDSPAITVAGSVVCSVANPCPNTTPPAVGLAVSAGTTWGTSIDPATVARLSTPSTLVPTITGFAASTVTIAGSPICTEATGCETGPGPTYPPAGIGVSTGTAWATSIDPATLPRLNTANTFTQPQTIATILAPTGGTTYIGGSTAGTSLSVSTTGIAEAIQMTWAQATRLPSGTDMNSTLACGLYDGSNLLNAPPTIASGFLNFEEICANDPAFTTQVAYDMLSNATDGYAPLKAWIRKKVNNVWGAWATQLIGGQVLPNATDLNTVLACGSYVGAFPVNIPTGPDPGLIFLRVDCDPATPLWLTQTLLPGSSNTGAFWLRHRLNGTWSPWQTYTASSVTAAALPGQLASHRRGVCSAGDVWVDADYIYGCSEKNKPMRVQLQAFAATKK